MQPTLDDDLPPILRSDPVHTVWCAEILEALSANGYEGEAPQVARLQPGSAATGLLYWPMYQHGSGLVSAVIALERAGYHAEMDSFCVVAIYSQQADCLTCKHHPRPANLSDITEGTHGRTGTGHRRRAD